MREEHRTASPSVVRIAPASSIHQGYEWAERNAVKSLGFAPPPDTMIAGVVTLAPPAPCPKNSSTVPTPPLADSFTSSTVVSPGDSVSMVPLGRGATRFKIDMIASLSRDVPVHS